MGIKAKFTTPDVREYMEKWRKNLIDSITEAFQAACLDTITEARSVDTYIDQTGNLRSSIGYVLYYNGVEIANNFQASPANKGVRYVQWVNETKEDGTKERKGHIKETPGGSGEAGAKIGLSFAQEKAKEVGVNGFVAVVVAGMNYATYVEAKGFDVLTGSTLRFADNLMKYFKVINKHFGTTLDVTRR